MTATARIAKDQDVIDVSIPQSRWVRLSKAMHSAIVRHGLQDDEIIEAVIDMVAGVVRIEFDVDAIHRFYEVPGVCINGRWEGREGDVIWWTVEGD